MEAKRVRKFLALVLMALAVLAATALAKNVTVTGTGSTPTEAENDALRMAVENTLGVLVDSNTLVEKNVVIQDQIYTQSRGFVTDYKVVERRELGGVWSVTIDAVVDDNPNSKLMSELARLGLINTQLRNHSVQNPRPCRRDCRRQGAD